MLPAPDGLIAHVTAEFDVFVTVAVNCRVCDGMSVAEVGATLTATGGLRVTVADAVLLVSAVLVAVTVTVCRELTVVGAVYNPVLLTLPTPDGLIDQVTVVVVLPDTAAANCFVWPP